MKKLSYIFFYTYVGLVMLAGLWGAFLGAGFDYRLLFNLDITTLSDYARINMLSQYRFLRALEFGFGLFAFVFRKEIFTVRKFNTVFLVTMCAGVLARIVSLIDEGSPSWFTYFFMIYEGIGAIAIFLYTRKNLRN